MGRFKGVNGINNLAGSGLGFYGSAGFGDSVPVNAFQDHTFITNSAGTAQGPEANNIKYLNAGSGILGQVASGIGLKAMPNGQASLQIEFTYDTPIKTQNVLLYGYDRSDPNNAPSGVTLKAAELVHPNPTQGPGGSGSVAWTTLAGSGSNLTLTSSPGTSGFRPNGSGTTDARHDWYLALSASPDSIGSKPFGLYVSLEYL